MRGLPALLLAPVLMAAPACARPAADSKAWTDGAAVGGWSKTVNGLQGRLRVVPEDLRHGKTTARRYAVVLELRNVGLEPISITNQPRLTAELFGQDGKRVATQAFPMSGPIPYPQDAVIPRDSYLGFRVDMQTVGVPADGTRLLAVGGTWALRRGGYLLKSTVSVAKPPASGPNGWSGRLALPSVSITRRDRND